MIRLMLVDEEGNVYTVSEDVEDYFSNRYDEENEEIITPEDQMPFSLMEFQEMANAPSS